MSLTEQQQRILASMGVTLILLQTTEKVINLCLTLVFQKKSSLTLTELEEQNKQQRKKTIGYFLAELRKRAELDDKFDRMLLDFLERRNTFIHNLTDVPGWDLDSAQGCHLAERFVSDLVRLNYTVLFTFSGFVRAWQKQASIDIPIPSGSEHLFMHIDRLYTPLINQLVFKKRD